MELVYLDYSATTPVDKEVLNTYTKLLNLFYANSSSIHSLGIEASTMESAARIQIADLLKVSMDEVIFTSGATEANNMAIKGIVDNFPLAKKHIVTSSVEHPSVLNVFKQLEAQNKVSVTYLPVDNQGQINLQTFEKELTSQTILVSIMYVNNETGAIFPILEIAKILKKYPHIKFHCDMTQAVGRLPLDLSEIDLATFSAHKIYGLKGSGVLIKKNNVELVPLIVGGEQEFGYRSGTSNWFANVATSKALRLALEKQRERYTYVDGLRSYLLSKLALMSEIVINHCISNCSPFIINISILNKNSEVLSRALEGKGFIVGTKSACSAKASHPSHVLLAMGRSEKLALSMIRISLSHHTLKSQLDNFLNALTEIISTLK